MSFELKQNFSISQRQEQKLIMTPQMQQAIQMLQLAKPELLEAINQELSENPLLEIEEKPDESSDEEKNQQQIEKIIAEKVAENTSESEKQLGEVPSDENLSIQDEDKIRSDMEWESYVNDSAENPFRPQGTVDYSYNEDYTPIIDRTPDKPSLFDHLSKQLDFTDLSEKEKAVGRYIIGNLDNNGYLKGITVESAAQKLNLPQHLVHKVLMVVQSFEPHGIAARNLSEMLLIQLRAKGIHNPNIERIIEQHIKELENKDYSKIAKTLGISLNEVIEAVKLIRTLDPKPARNFSTQSINYIIPDMYIYKTDDGYRVELNDDGLPKLKLMSGYKKIVNSGNKELIEKKLERARWIINAIYMRQETMRRIGYSLIKFQREFFDKGPAYLKPLILKDVAENIERHESTVSRATSNKYVETPHGIYSLKYFFSSGVHRTQGGDIASQSVKDTIKKLIDNENKKKPLSDQKIADILAERGIDVARRTVAKYRESMNILSSSKRKQLF